MQRVQERSLMRFLQISPLFELIQKDSTYENICFITFNYCPLWMYCDRKCNNLINAIHERALPIAYNDQSSSFTELLQQDKSITLHLLNTKKLLIEIFKTLKDFNPDFMKEIFSTHESSRNLRTSHFEQNRLNTNKYCTNTLTFKGSLIWSSVQGRM